MKHIKQAFTKRMAQKQMAQLSIGAFLVEKMKGYVEYPQQMTGYVRWNILFVQLTPQENKAQLFIEKKRILAELNKHVEDFGYVYIVQDIRFK